MSTELMNNNKNDYTGYIFGALYWNIQGEKERALYLINKVDLSNIIEYWIEPQTVAITLYKSWNDRLRLEFINKTLLDIIWIETKNIYTTEHIIFIKLGIVHVYQKLNQNMNALVVAKECMIAYPHHPLSQTLMGNVLETQRTGGYNKVDIKL